MATTANTNPLPAATATTTPAASLSPRSPVAVARTASPPWNRIVIGADPEPPSSPSAVVIAENPPESAGDGNAASKKPAAWNKKPMMTTAAASVNGAPESGGAPVVMGAELWPALSESTKASPKLLSVADASKNLPDFGSALSPQVTGTETSSAAVTLSVQSQSSASQKPTTSSSSHHPNSNHGRPARQRSMKRDGNGGNFQANGGFSHQPSQSAIEGSQYNQNHNSPKPISGGASDSSGRDNVQSHNHRESGQRNTSGEHPHQRNSFRRGNTGPHPRGDGSHQNYGGRRSDQDRGNHDWNHQRSFNGRDASMQSRVVSRGFARPPPVTTQFVHPPPVRPFINPMMPDMPPIVYLPPGMQFVAPVPPMYYPAPDPELYSEIMKQINYYFSNENLVKDTYLRQNMDENGWVPVDLIANFNKVKSLTTDPYRILDAVKSSTVVEVQADKIRRRDDWMRWIMPPSVQFPVVSGSQSPKVPAVSTLSAQIQSVMLDDKTVDLNNGKSQVNVTASTTLQASSGNLASTSQTLKDESSSSGC